jgi:F-type H+-transporting ATPase subunit delta
MVINEVARVYAGALLEIGLELKNLSQIEEDLAFFTELLSGDADMTTFINAPVIPRQIKKNFINKIFKNKLSDDTVGFLNVLIDNDRQNFIKDIHHSFIEQIDAVNKRQRIKLISSVKLNENMIDDIKTTLSKKFNKDIIIDESVDESIIGGFIIEIKDRIIDGSVSNGLKNMRDRLLKSKVASGVAYED